ncbi:anti-sigma factor family protein [Corynebacterium sp. H130]|uniref:anti-sigma factor family protein n=1 Tax=Corynebacterium sp. H130 TaxID=3133444 RepID=UPI0030AA9A5E
MISRPEGHKRRPKEFSSVEHLSAEAVAGFVDNELPPVAMNRARIHLVHCAECRKEVNAQRRAAERLRQIADEQLHAPSTLMAKLTSIAQTCPEGPDAQEVAHPRGDTILARVEVFYRAVRKNQGK